MNDFKKQLKVHSQNIARIIASIYRNTEYPASSSVDKALGRYWTEYEKAIRETEEHERNEG
jgi:hypothetical protein